MKKIGIVPHWEGETFGVKGNYMEWIELFGSPIILPLIPWKDFVETIRIDALVLPGGADVNSNRYLHFPSFFCGKPDPQLEFFDTEILPNLIGKLPIFGICRGLQTLNVALGGTLYQHLWKHPYSEHEQDTVHRVFTHKKITKGEKGIFGVNSFHHQAIKKLGNDLKEELYADDGTIEAISSKNLNIFAVQWHPERLWDDYSYNKAKELFE